MTQIMNEYSMKAIAKPIKMLQWKKWVQHSTRVRTDIYVSASSP